VPTCRHAKRTQISALVQSGVFGLTAQQIQPSRGFWQSRCATPRLSGLLARLFISSDRHTLCAQFIRYRAHQRLPSTRAGLRDDPRVQIEQSGVRRDGVFNGRRYSNDSAPSFRPCKAHKKTRGITPGLVLRLGEKLAAGPNRV
jgi:hypothetical protein